MRTKNLLVGTILALIGMMAFSACGGSAPAASPVVPTSVPTATAAPPTVVPTAIPSLAPTQAPATTAPTPTVAAKATATAAPQSKSMVQFVTRLTGGAEHFNQPLAVTRDAQGNLYVAEISNQILKYDKAGNLLTKWGSLGAGDGEFHFSNGDAFSFDIALDSKGNIFVTDAFNNRVQKFDPNGKFLAKWGKAGTGDGEFNNEGTLALDSHDNVYVAANDRVQVFDSNGKFLTKWGSAGDGPGEFDSPSDIEIDGADNVYVSNFNSGWIEKLDTQGRSLGRWHDCGTGTKAAMMPGGLFVDEQGNNFIADTGNNRICVFDTNGKFLGEWGNDTSDAQFAAIFDLMVDDDGTVYVPDKQLNQILVFKLKQYP